MKLLMISGDQDLVKGKQGPFYYLLKEFSGNWERIDVLCPNFAEGLMTQCYFSNVFVHPVSKRVKSLVSKAKDLHRSNVFDVITVHDYPPFRHSSAALKLKKEYNLPVMVEVHHIPGHPKSSSLQELFLKIYFRIFFRKIASKADLIRIVNKNQVLPFLKKVKVPSDKITYLPSFYLNHQIFKTDPIEKKYDCLFVGRLSANKGLKLLADVFFELKKLKPDFRAAVAGQGEKLTYLRSLIRKQGVIDNIDFLAWLPDNQALAKLYRQSKVLIITSFNEGGPRVGVEAMSCGTPVISTPVGIMPDLIKNGANGFIALWKAEEMAKEAIMIITDSELRQRLGNMAAETVKIVTDFNFIKDYAESLKKLAQDWHEKKI